MMREVEISSCFFISEMRSVLRKVEEGWVEQAFPKANSWFLSASRRTSPLAWVYQCLSEASCVLCSSSKIWSDIHGIRQP